MASKRGRLDRYIGHTLAVPKKVVRDLLLAGRIRVNGERAERLDMMIDEFCHIQCDDQVLQSNQPLYLMLHKPVGVVSATKDAAHKTVIDLIDHPDRAQLHIAGRLDLNSSGLLLLTNDSRWSEALMSPTQKVDKVYRVTLKNPLTADYVDAFASGMYFGFEDITTLPATLEIVGTHSALITLKEGKYHQIKRMFGRFRNPVLALHRLSVGGILLDETLAPGDSRPLTELEIQQVGLGKVNP